MSTAFANGSPTERSGRRTRPATAGSCRATRGTGRSRESRPCHRRLIRAAGRSGRSTVSSRPGAAPQDCGPSRRGQADADPPRHVRLDRSAPHARKRSASSSATIRPTPFPGSSTDCSPRPITASDGDGTGWTSSTTPTPPATTPTTPSRRPPVPRLHHRLVQPRQAVRPIRSRAAGRRHPGRQGAADNYAESVIATGFLALSRRYATAPFELWHLTLEDTIDTTGRAFLGLTLRCARCHDHKFDPISQRDYYALYGIFASTTFPYAGSEELQSKAFPRMNFVPLVEPARAEPKLKAYQARLAELEREVKSLESKKDPESQAADCTNCAELTRLKRPSLPPTAGLLRRDRGKAGRCAAPAAGRPRQPGPVVPRGVPRFAFLDGEPAPCRRSSEQRPARAGALADQPDHPLTARVMVNRIWQHHFGRGIVATPRISASAASRRRHPELLDWLAARFVASGWSIKAMHREILLPRPISSRATSTSAMPPSIPRIAGSGGSRGGGSMPRRSATPCSPSRATSTEPAGPASVPADRGVALDPAQPVQGGLSDQPPQRLPDDPAPAEAPYLAIFDGPDTNVVDRRPPTIDRPAPGPLPHE